MLLGIKFLSQSRNKSYFQKICADVFTQYFILANAECSTVWPFTSFKQLDMPIFVVSTYFINVGNILTKDIIIKL